MADEAQVKFLTKQGVKGWNDWRKANPQIRPDLYMADLRGADLCDANLSLADLRSASLGHADLRNVNLAHANLSMADLRGADLMCAKIVFTDLSQSHLSGSNLSTAKLWHVNLLQAELIEVDFSDCFMGWNLLANVDLSQSKKLETIKHTGPSTIGIDTFFRSGGNIPEVFLRGAGVPERSSAT